MLPLLGGRLSKPLPSTTRPTLQNFANFLLYNYYNTVCQQCQVFGARYQNRTDDRGLENRCFAIKLISHYLVPPMGVEPTHLAASEPKSDASTNSAKGA
jgi:hypothetical protein